MHRNHAHDLRLNDIYRYDTPTRHYNRTGRASTRLAGSGSPVDKPVKRAGFAGGEHSTQRTACQGRGD